MAIEKRIQRLQSLKGSLKRERSRFEPTWRSLASNILPRRVRFSPTETGGDLLNTKIYDATATQSSRVTASGMMAGVTSPARPWFRLTVADPELSEHGPVKEWLHEVRERMALVFLRSNLYNRLPVIYRDLSVFATGAMGVFEDDVSVIRCYDYPIGSYWLANDERMSVKVFVREFQLTVRQLVRRYGFDLSRPASSGTAPNLSRFSKATRQLWQERNLEALITVTQVVMRNDEFERGAFGTRGFPFVSLVYEDGADSDVLLEESGYDEFPFLTPRWETVGEDVYGTESPGWTSLGEVRQLQTLGRKILAGVNKTVDPPLVAPTTLRTSRVSQLPGEITWYDERQGGGPPSLRPLHDFQIRFDLLAGLQADTREFVRRAFYEDLFLMLANNTDRRDMTAREVEERHEEKLLMLGPVLEQLNQDMFDPLIDRTFNIMHRRGLIPPAPPELEGVDLRVEYTSIMAQAQKLVGLSGIERFSAYVGQVAALDPSVLDKWDRDQTVDEYADITGIPPTLVVPDDEVAEIRAARAEEMRKQQAVEQAAQMAPAAKQLAETPVNGAEGNGSSLLNELMGAGAPGGVL